MRVFLLVCLVSLFALRSYGIVIRHDVAPGDYTLRASNFSQAAEVTITIDYVGGASGISMPLFPGDIEMRSVFFYVLCFLI